MTIEIVLLVIIILYLFGKWVVLLLLSPLIAYKNKVSKQNSNANDAKVDPIPEKTNIKYYSPTRIIRIFLTGFSRYIIIQIGLIPSHRVRNWLYQNIFLVRLGKNAILYYGAELRAPYRLSIGDGSIIGDNAILDARRGGINIGENVQFGSEVKLWTGSHDLNDEYFRSQPSKRGGIVIGNRVWIGPSVTILHSVSIGEGAVVAAGSVVTKNIPPFEIWAGIPAKKIGERNRNLKYIFNEAPAPFY